MVQGSERSKGGMSKFKMWLRCQRSGEKWGRPGSGLGSDMWSSKNRPKGAKVGTRNRNVTENNIGAC